MSGPVSMRAWQATSYGAPAGHMELRTIARPEPGRGEVRIRVLAASLNPIDFKLLAGDLKRVQQVAFPRTLGFDASGLVSAVGADVSDFHVGDAVYVRASRENLGAFAEETVQPVIHVARRPANVSAGEAASFPLVALTTVQGLRDRARIARGQRILIHAGSGGLGSFAIQYAKHFGLVVHATTSKKNVDFVRGLGADEVIPYDEADYRTSRERYDVVFDTIGGLHTRDAFAVLERGGSVVSVAGPPDREMAALHAPNAIVRLAMRAMALRVYAAARGKSAAYYRFLTESNGAELAEVTELVESGAIRPVVDRVFPFDAAVAAMEYLMAGRARGKVVLDFARAP